MVFPRCTGLFCALLCVPLIAAGTESAPASATAQAATRSGADTTPVLSVTERLQIFFQGARTIQADFKQTLQDGKGQVVQRASGSLLMQRPGKFRWDYKTPYRQIIASDGKEITIYDEDLEQATIKPLGHALGGTPASLLSGNQPLEESFSIAQAESRNSLDWVELTPKQPDSGFERIRLGFGKSDLQAMEMHDSFGQLTVLNFSNLKYDAAPDPSRFVFVPPAGTDILRETAASPSAHQK